MTESSSPSVSRLVPTEDEASDAAPGIAGNPLDIFTDEQKKKFAAQDALYNETMKDG